MGRGEIKKLYILYILEILKRYSDYDHPLKQVDIIHYMERDYGIVCDRKTVSRNLGDLQDAGHLIERRTGGYYYDSRDFDESELRFLIDSVFASRYIPAQYAKALIEKLQNQASIHFKKSVNHIYSLDNTRRDHRNELFLNLDFIGEAIDTNRKIAFFYQKYKQDKSLHKTTTGKHIANPYYIAVANGKYYLVANIDKYDNITHFRMERISDVEILPEIRKPKEKVTDFKDGHDLSAHLLEHVYMFSGPSVRVVLKVHPGGINDVIDWLGTDVGIIDRGDHLIVDTYTNQQAMKYWAVQFGEKVEVLQPDSLREEVRKMVENLHEKYRSI